MSAGGVFPGQVPGCIGPHAGHVEFLSEVSVLIKFEFAEWSLFWSSGVVKGLCAVQFAVFLGVSFPSHI